MYKFAAISDIHGNRWALEAVLEDVDTHGVNDIVNMGDCLYGPLDPAGTAALLQSSAILSVRGNQDRIITDNTVLDDALPTLRWVRGQLGKSELLFLNYLPFSLVLEENILLIHGTPLSDLCYLLREVTTEGLIERNDVSLNQLLETVTESIVLCGHDHLPGIHSSPQRTVINPGSVGLQAYTDDAPYPHSVQNATPDARYAIVTIDGTTVAVDHRCVRYDHQTAASTAHRHGRDDWAKWLKTGRV